MSDEPIIIDKVTGLEVLLVERGEMSSILQLPDGTQVELPWKEIIIHWPW
jgi:hypothetical protein